MKASCAAGSSPACGQHTGALLCCGAARLQGADRPFKAAAPSVLQAVVKRKNTGEQRAPGRTKTHIKAREGVSISSRGTTAANNNFKVPFRFEQM
ncbi:hypothetical protein EYF80_039047 [Liparis tanakae]|uniref:Uncharacterized protein n=1 Tax=Liparis tanakae TaxID=230148 RepID=A0A4Z2GAT6_9TELE|nr:hypothetical protein EYF80_039047 [Liparis tanakae]